jgi:hypothetical protein
LLAEIRSDSRQGDRQQPLEELIEENRQIIEEVRPDYQAVRDRILKSLTTGRARIAPSAPQYKSAAKALHKFIAEIQAPFYNEFSLLNCQLSFKTRN